jgi:hypothetical protein
MKSRRGVLCAALIVVGCRRPEPLPAPGPTVRVGLDEPFGLAGVRCRARAPAESLREEPPRRADVRVARDVRLLEVTLSCARDGASSVDARSVLAEGVAVSLLGPDGRAHPMRVGAAEAEPAPSTEATLHFELAIADPPAVRRRSYALASAAPKPAAEPAPYRLRLVHGDQRVDVSLRHSFEGPALEAWLARLVTALRDGRGLAALGDTAVRAELDAVERAYGNLRQRYAPRTLRVELRPRSDGRVDATLTPAEHTRRAPPKLPLGVALVLELGTGEPRIVAAQSPEALERAVRCEGLEAELEESLREAEVAPSAGAAPGAGECAAYGTRLPVRCDALPPRLRSAAQRLGEACGSHVLPRGPVHKVPADFQLALRRGRPKQRRGKRYTLVIFGSGSTVLHRSTGRDDSERQDGRTTPEAVATLWGIADGMGVLSRRGGEFDGARCSASADDVDVVTLVAQGRERMLLNRAGCRGPFTADELDTLVEAALAAGGIEGFTGERRRVQGDPLERILTIPDDPA